MAEHWRLGRNNSQTIYLQEGPEPSRSDPYLGSLNTVLLSKQAVTAVNALDQIRQLHTREPYEDDPDDGFCCECQRGGAAGTYPCPTVRALDTAQPTRPPTGEPMPDSLRDRIADAITYHPGNRTGTPEQRHDVSLMLADAVIGVLKAQADQVELVHARQELRTWLGKGFEASRVDSRVEELISAFQDALLGAATGKILDLKQENAQLNRLLQEGRDG